LGEKRSILRPAGFGPDGNIRHAFEEFPELGSQVGITVQLLDVLQVVPAVDRKDSRGEADQEFQPYTIQVLSIGSGVVTEVISFLDRSLFRFFNLPTELPV